VQRATSVQLEQKDRLVQQGQEPLELLELPDQQDQLALKEQPVQPELLALELLVQLEQPERLEQPV
jgi:hypothetical protein